MGEQRFIASRQLRGNLSILHTDADVYFVLYSNRLLTSGLWAYSRKPNYVADWIMSFLWGAIVGTATPIPYFYSIFFITVLTHRCGRDFERLVTPFIRGFYSASHSFYSRLCPSRLARRFLLSLRPGYPLMAPYVPTYLPRRYLLPGH